VAHRPGPTRPGAPTDLGGDARGADKAALAEAVVGTGEAWLTELDHDELAELVTLGREDG
jgi:hypothetical protein